MEQYKDRKKGNMTWLDWDNAIEGIAVDIEQHEKMAIMNKALMKSMFIERSKLPAPLPKKDEKKLKNTTKDAVKEIIT